MGLKASSSICSSKILHQIELAFTLRSEFSQTLKLPSTWSYKTRSNIYTTSHDIAQLHAICSFMSKNIASSTTVHFSQYQKPQS